VSCHSDTEPELLNDAIFGAIYYRMLLGSGPMTRRFGEELVEQAIGGHRSGTAHNDENRETRSRQRPINNWCADNTPGRSVPPGSADASIRAEGLSRTIQQFEQHSKQT